MAFASYAAADADLRVYKDRLSIFECERIPEEEVLSIWKKAKLGDEAARHRLILSSLRLAYCIARRYVRKVHSLSLDDFIAEANLAVVRAIDDWNPAHCPLAAFVVVYVKTACNSSLRHAHDGIYIPRSAWLKMKDLESVFHTSEACYLTIDEMMDKTGNSRKVVLSTLASLLAKDIANYDKESQCSEPRSVETPWCLKDVEPLVEMIDNPDQKEAIERRYGFNGYQPHTWQELTEATGIAGSTIRNRIFLAVKKIRRDIGLDKITKKKCEWCKKNYRPKRYCHANHQRFCKEECAKKWLADSKKKTPCLKVSTCPCCKREFIHRNPRKKYCDDLCSGRMLDIRTGRIKNPNPNWKRED